MIKIKATKNGLLKTNDKSVCLFDNGKKPNDTIYSDRLLQWDHNKHDRLCKKHFGNTSQYWNNRKPKKIEAFLRDWANDESIVLCRVTEYLNHSNGYPLWRFDFFQSGATP